MLRGLRLFIFSLGLGGLAARAKTNETGCPEDIWRTFNRPINSTWAIAEHAKYRIRQIINDPLNRGMTWTCNSGSCMPFSMQLQAALKEAKFQLKIKAVTHDLNIRTSGGERLGSFHHYFLEDDSWGPGQEVIVDPTLKQYFYSHPFDLDRSGIFVGTREDLIHLFKLNRRLMRPPVGMSSIPDGTIDPVDFVDKVWGFGEAGRFKTERGAWLK